MTTHQVTAVSSWISYAFPSLLMAIVIWAVIKRVNFIRRVNLVPGMAGGWTIMGNTSYVFTKF